MHSSEFLWKHANWVIAAVSFYVAFSGLLRESVAVLPPGPWGYVSGPDYLNGGAARFVGFLFLIVGFVAVFSTPAGIIGFVCAYLLAWFLATFWPKEH